MAAQTSSDEKTVVETNRELAPAGETPVDGTSEGLEKGSLPEEGVSDCVNHCIHAIRW